MKRGRAALLVRAFGFAAVLVASIALAVKSWLFVRHAFMAMYSGHGFGSVFAFGLQIRLRSLVSLGFYGVLFIAYPAFLLLLALYRFFVSSASGDDSMLRERIGTYVAVASIMSIGDLANLLFSRAWGEAGVLASPLDAVFFAAFLADRFAPVAFFQTVRRKGLRDLPAWAIPLPFAWAFADASVAAWRIAVADGGAGALPFLQLASAALFFASFLFAFGMIESCAEESEP
ncbi:MAG: hypothetical protein K6F50_02780 [Kiritimatiellae bacterium]|nr:hypothetical protein [Kiritimatiellia bacterium]